VFHFPKEDGGVKRIVEQQLKEEAAVMGGRGDVVWN